MSSRLGFFFLAVLVFAMCYPALFLLTGSFMEGSELIERAAPILDQETGGFASWAVLPENWSAASYKELFLYQPGFFVLFWNSVKICVGVLIGQLLVAVPAAWAFARYEFSGKRFLFTLYIIFMLLPFQVLMLPEYLVFSKVGLLDTLWAIILPGMFSTFPVFLQYNFFRGIPEEILEAGRMDGAGELQIFLRIGIPTGLPGISAVMILQFLEYWNQIEQPMLFLESQNKWPLSLYLPNIGMENIWISLAAAVITLIPSYLIFRIGQGSLEAGIAASGVKK